MSRSTDVSRLLCRVSAGWAGWIERSGHRRYLNDARPGDIPPEAFPGRWSPIRSFPEEQDPLPVAAGLALSRAGWWRRDSGTPCGGGVVVGADGGFLASSERFARDISARAARVVSPADFIHSFPSTAASLLTQLYGLSEYQATLVEGRFSGVRALGHALDLIRTGRLTRALVATLSVSAASTPPAGESFVARMAVGLCVESMTSEGSGREVELEVGRRAEDLDGKPPPEGAIRDRLSRVLRPFGELGGLPLARVAMALLARRAPFEIESSVDEPGRRFYVSVRGCDSQNG